MTEGDEIPVSEWRWFGSPGHFICAFDCRFHLCTLVGDLLVSTVGEYFPDAPVREIIAASAGITLQGQGGARKYQYLRERGFDEIGAGRKYETMVFRVSGEARVTEECGCGLPSIDPAELDFAGYNTAGAATTGHYSMCRDAAQGRIGQGP